MVRNGGLRQPRQAAAARSAETRELNGRLAIFLIPLLAAATLAGCAPTLETDQARLCRMALPALMPRRRPARHSCANPGRRRAGPQRRLHRRDARRRAGTSSRRLPLLTSRDGRGIRDLKSLTLDGEPLPEARLFFLIRYWLATPEGRAADPAPLGRPQRLPSSAARRRLWLADGAGRTAAGVDLCAAGGGLFADLRLIGRINFAFGEIAAAGGYAAAIAALAMVGSPPAPL